jgi:hypothetical protein
MVYFSKGDIKSAFISRQQTAYDGKLERHRLVHLAALRAAGTVHVRVVGINEAAFCAAEHAVFGIGRTKPAAAHFGINPQNAQGTEQDGHINHDEPGRGHNFNHEWIQMNTKSSGTDLYGLTVHA